MNPRTFKAPFISPEQAWMEADRIRSKYWPSGTVPIEVEEILWGVGLRLEPVHSLKEGGDVDALLSGDLKRILVDAEEYMDDRMQNRMRFSIAHELGHFVLHRDVYQSIHYSSVDEWIEFVQLVPEDQYGFIEQHAYEFAGRLLVPTAILQSELRQAVNEAKAVGFMKWDRSGDAAREYIANSLCRVFGVSSQVIEKRIIREQLWPPET